ncbi:hypothetical protein GMO_26070 [Gluconobacter morbifer G707]|uniref:Uncharacterized protein n=1 Tax=Gluconobacter morbifer G707 TaxID=1088869 RepID=G6XM89_9PROT|nr:hypothetical protein GMO_26070 [Gluconobacter morbifer G707]
MKIFSLLISVPGGQCLKLSSRGEAGDRHLSMLVAVLQTGSLQGGKA